MNYLILINLCLNPSICIALHFRDHHPYTAEDFTRFGNDNILMTEKDAVKCSEFAKDNGYYLPVNAKPTQAVINKLTLILKEKGILNGL